MNQINISGYIGRKPELQTAKSGIEYCSFPVGVTRRKAKDQEESKTDWFTCATFGKTAVFVAQYFDKGDGIEVSGRMENNPYENKEGKKVSSWQLMVNSIEFPKGKGKKSADQEQPQAPVDGFEPVNDEEIPF